MSLVLQRTGLFSFKECCITNTVGATAADILREPSKADCPAFRRELAKCVHSDSEVGHTLKKTERQ